MLPPPICCRRSLEVRREAIIQSNDDLGIAATLVGCSVLGRRLGSSGPLVSLGGPVTTMAISFFASSSGIIDTNGAKAIGMIRDSSVQLATPCMLLDTDARELKSGAGPLLFAFIVAAIATTLGALWAFQISQKYLEFALGVDAAKVAAALAAKNIGGGLNFAAVAIALNASPQAQISALCADNVMALIYFPLCNLLAGIQPPIDEDISSSSSKQYDKIQQLSTTSSGLLDALFAALLILVLSARLVPTSAQLPMATAIALGFSLFRGLLKTKKKSKSATTLADALLYVFFAGAGAAGGSLSQAFQNAGPPLMLFLLLLYLGHFAILSLVYTILSIPKQSFISRQRRRARFAVASNAAIGGPATAAALCTSKNWLASTTPAICIGTLGYATASFLGILLHGLWSVGPSALWTPFLAVTSRGSAILF